MIVSFKKSEAKGLKSKPKEKETLWPFRKLAHYKAMHQATADARGCGKAFAAAATLTQARRVLRGN